MGRHAHDAAGRVGLRHLSHTLCQRALPRAGAIAAALERTSGLPPCAQVDICGCQLAGNKHQPHRLGLFPIHRPTQLGDRVQRVPERGQYRLDIRHRVHQTLVSCAGVCRAGVDAVALLHHHRPPTVTALLALLCVPHARPRAHRAARHRGHQGKRVCRHQAHCDERRQPVCHPCRRGVARAQHAVLHHPQHRQQALCHAALYVNGPDGGNVHPHCRASAAR